MKMEHVEDEIYVKNLFLIGNEVYILKERAKRVTQSIQEVYSNSQKAQPRNKRGYKDTTHPQQVPN